MSNILVFGYGLFISNFTDTQQQAMFYSLVLWLFLYFNERLLLDRKVCPSGRTGVNGV